MYISVMLFLIEDFYVYFSDAFLIEDSYVYFSDAFLIEDLLQSFFFQSDLHGLLICRQGNVAHDA